MALTPQSLISSTASETVCITRRGKPVSQLTAIDDRRKHIDPSAFRAITDAMPIQPEGVRDFVRRIPGRRALLMILLRLRSYGIGAVLEKVLRENGSNLNFSAERESSLSSSNLAQSSQTLSLVPMKTSCVTHFATPMVWVLIETRSPPQSGLILFDKDRFRREQM
jgi:antitoxin (DNA-binding transcriptional repressor) of toxin-antitoxin stability system